jgi:hypothetical protein
MKTPGIRTICSAFLLVSSAALAQEKMDHCGAGAGHHAQVDARGDKVMGFDHERTTHHFLLSAAGGSIEVTANRAEDKESRDAIRGHLAHIAKMFSEGDFEAPMLIHDRIPPGVDAMKRKKAGIQWKYEELENGGRIAATAKDPEALSAIHEFLRFQIADHHTGDPGTVKGMESH